ncbi:MAG TPA: MarR family transcriptional regulator [Oculatellaceae cyanobacterium]
MTTEDLEPAISLKLYVVLSRASNAMQQCAAAHIGGAGLIPTDFAILECLLHKGNLPICAIGSKVLLANASMTAAIDRLERRRLVQRVNCEFDRRTKLISLTDNGRELITSIFEDHARALSEAASGLSASEKLLLIALLKKLGLKAAAIASEDPYLGHSGMKA